LLVIVVETNKFIITDIFTFNQPWLEAIIIMNNSKALLELIIKAIANGIIIVLWIILLRYLFSPPILAYAGLISFPLILLLIFRYIWGFKLTKPKK